LIDKALRHFSLLGIELIRDGEDDVTGEGASLHLKFEASVSAPGCLQFRGLRVKAIVKRHIPVYLFWAVSGVILADTRRFRPSA
jgi:hypothetical protein